MLLNAKRKKRKKELNYTRLLPRALRAIRYANVRFGILPAQSRFRGNDDRRVDSRLRGNDEPKKKRSAYGRYSASLPSRNVYNCPDNPYAACRLMSAA